jgi:hypothetical protein
MHFELDKEGTPTALRDVLLNRAAVIAVTEHERSGIYSCARIYVRGMAEPLHVCESPLNVAAQLEVDEHVLACFCARCTL